MAPRRIQICSGTRFKCNNAIISTENLEPTETQESQIINSWSHFTGTSNLFR